MNIVLATDNNFVQHCGVTILSVLTHNKDVNIYLLTESLSEENEYNLRNLIEDYQGIFNVCKVPSDIVKYFPMSKMASDHISIATYYRLFVTSLLPNDIDKAIYLDCDMVVRGSLESLWNTNLDGYALGAVYQNFRWSDREKSWSRLHIPREYGYFNAGCLLLNLSYLRDNDFQNKALEYINTNFERIISHDQDVLNAMYFSKTKELSCKWNFTPLFMRKNLKLADFPMRCNYVDELSSATFQPTIIHFVSKPKPWQFGCKHKYKREYFNYLSKTVWRDYKIDFHIKPFCTDVVIPTIRRLISSIINLK